MVEEILGLGNHAESVDPKRSERVEGKKDSKGREVRSKQTDSQGDSISISSSAKKALNKTRLTNMVKNMPEVREDKVAEAKEKVESGEIFSPEVTEKLADELDQLL